MADDLERMLCDKVADGRLSTEDADTAREFAAFLREAGPPSSPATLQRVKATLDHADFLGLTEAQRLKLQARYDQLEN